MPFGYLNSTNEPFNARTEQPSISTTKLGKVKSTSRWQALKNIRPAF